MEQIKSRLPLAAATAYSVSFDAPFHLLYFVVQLVRERKEDQKFVLWNYNSSFVPNFSLILAESDWLHCYALPPICCFLFAKCLSFGGYHSCMHACVCVWSHYNSKKDQPKWWRKPRGSKMMANEVATVNQSSGCSLPWWATIRLASSRLTSKGG